MKSWVEVDIAVQHELANFAESLHCRDRPVIPRPVLSLLFKVRERLCMYICVQSVEAEASQRHKCWSLQIKWLWCGAPTSRHERVIGSPVRKACGGATALVAQARMGVFAIGGGGVPALVTHPLQTYQSKVEVQVQG